jgi:site-specific recombinase XerD
MRKSASPSFPALVQEFFTDYLVRQRALSPHTVTAYRDAFSLLLGFAEGHLGKPPTALQLADLDRELLAAFLDHLEQTRHNSVRSRNARLAAVRSFLRFVARRDVSSLHLVEQALAVPMKRFDRPMLGFLSREQMLAVMDVPATTWLGKRDRLLLILLYNTGARASEIIAVRVGDVVLDEAPCVHLRGKGRKQRSVPLWKATARDVRAWLHLNGQPAPESPLLPTREGKAMTRANVAQRLRLAADAAKTRHPELTKLSVSPHTIRHTTAMHLLQSGVDISVIALWLGHESPSTTHMYVEADLAMKARALSRLEAPGGKPARYRPPDTLMRFLQAL